MRQPLSRRARVGRGLACALLAVVFTARPAVAADFRGGSEVVIAVGERLDALSLDAEGSDSRFL